MRVMKSFFAPRRAVVGLAVTALVFIAQTGISADSTRSTFIIPANPKEGCDPFFPKSTRPYDAAAAATSGRQANLTSLVIKGFSGTADHRFVIINNRTFGVGDSAEVLTSEGRIFIQCLEITGNRVVIESRGQRHELVFSGNQ